MIKNFNTTAVTTVQIEACKDIKTLLETIPPHCKCANEEAFNVLKERYDQLNITYIANRETLTINS